eukprot:764609-Hanusia_phi.AAC.1
MSCGHINRLQMFPKLLDIRSFQSQSLLPNYLLQNISTLTSELELCATYSIWFAGYKRLLGPRVA